MNNKGGSRFCYEFNLFIFYGKSRVNFIISAVDIFDVLLPDNCCINFITL
ncbi:MAG: hypothetical protein O7D30_02970 [Rickettsia endosymbiont of Ixodes persulcatus]|nr:hypothetical protein [Rickettsia endosymbiont of Ixodes persulcatus]MCZ6910872.1 hypothetical protein [Rickettsia endosymbiont of Ixodes persulcatus]MCZ6924446.1 hypothetical protein [Rickettsia endosymbiont of Ixodes persulcatus]